MNKNLNNQFSNVAPECESNRTFKQSYSRAADDGVSYDVRRTEAAEINEVPDIHTNLNRLLKAVAETKESFDNLVRRIQPVLSPTMKCCDNPEKEKKEREISPLASELRAITNMVHNLQYDIIAINDRIQL